MAGVVGRPAPLVPWRWHQEGHQLRGEGPMTRAGRDVVAVPLARDRLLALLQERGAGTLPHANGPLLDHLLGTEALLRSWRCTDAVVLAGLAHAIYGTDGFGDQLVGLDEHDLLLQAVGIEVEALVYLYASCDREVVHPRLAGQKTVLFRDRFTGETFQLSDEQARALANLTIANAVELFVSAKVSPAPDWLVQLLRDLRRRVSPGVRTGASALVGT